MKRKLPDWGNAISKILPGDHIHYVAPTSKAGPSTSARISQIDGANAKRNRKRAKLAAQFAKQRGRDAPPTEDTK